jgi:antibiotic biosynthesis monooxygenase (ABM) superfamily enzyme
MATNYKNPISSISTNTTKTAPSPSLPITNELGAKLDYDTLPSECPMELINVENLEHAPRELTNIATEAPTNPISTQIPYTQVDLETKAVENKFNSQNKNKSEALELPCKTMEESLARKTQEMESTKRELFLARQEIKELEDRRQLDIQNVKKQLSDSYEKELEDFRFVKFVNGNLEEGVKLLKEAVLKHTKYREKKVEAYNRMRSAYARFEDLNSLSKLMAADYPGNSKSGLTSQEAGRLQQLDFERKQAMWEFERVSRRLSMIENAVRSLELHIEVCKKNQDLQEEIDKLKSGQAMMRPILDIGIAIRLRFLLFGQDTLLSLSRGAKDTKVLRAGNSAAHSANGLADSALLLSGYLDEHHDLCRVFNLIYKDPAGIIYRESPLLRTAKDCQATIEVTKKLNGNAISKELRAEHQNLFERIIQASVNSDSVQEWAKSEEAQQWLARLEALTEEIVELDRQRTRVPVASHTVS